tara:strand:+ start:7073 stop:8392 length:1320 start_codon:yes stop_codon:yes gene_type:complete
MKSTYTHAMFALLGILVFICITYFLSENRKAVRPQFILFGLGLQLFLGVAILGIPRLGVPGALQFLFEWANIFFSKILEFSDEGSRFVFGPLADEKVIGDWIFAFRALPVIIFFSSLMAVLYYLRVMQKIIAALSWLMQKTLKISAAESLSACANIFIGQTEAPLVIRPYLANLTRSELMVLMVGGMATVAGSVLAAFVGFLQGRIPDIAGHLLTASVMSAPAAILVAKILVPETQVPETATKDFKANMRSEDANVIEAAANGAREGLSVALNVAAMLIAFIALLYMANWLVSLLGHLIHFSSWGEALVPASMRQEDLELSLELIMAWLFAPCAFLMGIPWEECFLIGALLGKKVILNEFVAYVDLTKQMHLLSDKSIIIASYALCGFANFSSIGIQLGGIGALAPSRKGDLARFGLRAVYGGSIAAFLTACWAALLIS